MVKVSAIVLAAGLSRRMGDQNKMELLYQGKPIVQHVVDQLAQSAAFEVIIVTSELSENLFQDREVVLNPHYKTGMTSSIKAGVGAASNDTDGYMICLGDQPLVEAKEYNQIIQAFEVSLKKNKEAIVLPVHQGKKGNPVIFASAYKDAILEHQEPEGCKGVVQVNKSHLSFVEMDSAAVLMDVDQPQDYERLISRKGQ